VCKCVYNNKNVYASVGHNVFNWMCMCVALNVCVVMGIYVCCIECVCSYGYLFVSMNVCVVMGIDVCHGLSRVCYS